MTPAWTGKAGEPVPAMLRHRRATDPTRGAPDGRCTCGLPLAPGERARPTDLCPTAVVHRLAELERDRDDAIVRLGRLVQTDAQRLAEVDLIRREMRDATDAVDSMSARLYQRTAEVERLTRELESIRVRSTEACKGTGLSPANAGVVPEIVAILADRLRASAARVAELEAHEASPHKYGARLRDEIARWLRSCADQCERDMQRAKHQEDFDSDRWQREAFNLAADAIARGEYVAWCEAHPVSPAPVGADAGRDPGTFTVRTT